MLTKLSYKYILSVLILFCVIESKSQLHDYNLQKLDRPNSIIIENDKYYLHYESGSSGKMLTAISKSTFEVVYKIDFKKQFSSTATPKFYFVKDNQIVFFYSWVDRSKKELVCSIFKFNVDNGKLIAKERKVIPAVSLGVASACTSPNNEHFLIFASCADPKKTKLFVLDKDFNKVFTSPANYKYGWRQKPFAEIDNDGTVIFFDESHINIYDANKDYDLWQESVNIAELDKTSIMGGKVYDLKMKFDNNNNLFVLGFYNDPATHVLTMRINSISHEIDYVNLEKAKGYWSRLINSDERKKLILKDDGSFIFIEEKKIPSDDFGNIQIYNFDINGKLIWNQKILKQTSFKPQQENQLNKFMGYSVFYNRNELSILYNTHYLNVNYLDEDGRTNQERLFNGYKLSSKKDISLVSTTFNIETGKRSEKVIFSKEDIKKNKAIPLPTRGYYNLKGDKIFIRTANPKYSIFSGNFSLKKQQYFYVDR